MKKILLDGKDVETLVPESLPMLIHGEEGSGASLYTICLAAKWVSLNYKVLFLCRYPMAEEEFKKQIGTDHPNAHFFTKDKKDLFVSAVTNSSNETIIIVKNIELFDQNIFDLTFKMNNTIISGDVNKLTYKDQLLQKKFVTEIYFSLLPGKKVLALEKFQGFITTDGYEGITTVSA